MTRITIAALLLFTACARSGTTTTTTNSPVGATPAPAAPATGSMTGGATPSAAVESFLSSVRAQDIQGMSVIFGTSSGPARDNMPREELERRLLILQCYFNHDKSRILREAAGESGHRVLVVELTRGNVTRTPSFYTIQGPRGRWFVDNMEIAAVRDFCRNN